MNNEIVLTLCPSMPRCLNALLPRCLDAPMP